MKYAWKKAKDYKDIIYEKMDGVAKITINRPEIRNAFRPETVIEMYDAFTDAREDQEIGVILLTGYGPAKMENMLSVQAAIKGYVEIKDMLAKMGFPG